MIERYAVYFAPAEDTLLWSAGCRWLGRDPDTGDSVPQPEVDGFSANRIQVLTASPRLYGFHATLKPPFQLAPDRSDVQLEAAMRELAGRFSAFALPRLSVGVLDGFLALEPDEPSAQVRALADACVIELDPYRRSASQDELARRQASGLSNRQSQLLEQFGYPFVLDQFRFHMTLTERLSEDDAERLCPWLAAYLSTGLAVPARCDDLCLFVQERPGGTFQLLQRFPLKRA